LNDFVPGTFGQVTVLTSPVFGQVSVMDSTVSYAPFQDECGTDELLYELCNTDGVCDTATLVVNIACPPSYPAYDIATVTTVDAMGVPDSIDRDCQLTGMVYGVNLRPAGLQFTIIDENDADAGIAVFNNTGDLGYTVTEGDEVTIQGSIGFFNGLTQINAEAVSVVSQGNSLFTPAEVTSIDESTESKLVSTTAVTIVDATQWTNTGSGFNVTVTDNTNEFIMRVDADTDIFGTSAPVASFILTGIGGQYDENTPFDEGYQLVPRSLADINIDLAIEDVLDLDNLVNIYPNPAQSEIRIDSEITWDEIRIVDVNGNLIQRITSFENRLSIQDLIPGNYHLIFVNSDQMGAKKLTVIR